jgi:hypothetical protein
MSVGERVYKKRRAIIQNIITYPFTWGQRSEFWNEMDAPVDVLNRNDARNPLVVTDSPSNLEHAIIRLGISLES